MVFSSLLFAFLFLPLILSLYFIAKTGYRNYILMFASLVFYAYGEPKFVVVMIGSILLNYMMGLFVNMFKRSQRINGARLILTLSVIINIGILFVYKYLDFSITILNKILPVDMAIKNIVLPIGISFFTFQALS